MKKILLLLPTLICALAFSTTQLFAQQGWFWQDPLPQGHHLGDIFVFDQNIGIAVGDAVGTSLLIITVKSLLGFTGDVGTMSIDWLFLFKFSIFTVAGIVVGSYVARFISGVKLKPAFGWFTLAMGVSIIARELLGHSS